MFSQMRNTLRVPLKNKELLNQRKLKTFEFNSLSFPGEWAL